MTVRMIDEFARFKTAALSTLLVVFFLSFTNIAQARTWEFQDAATGNSPVLALAGSPVTLEGSFDYSFDEVAGAYFVSALAITVRNTVVGDFTFNAPAQVFLTTTGPSRVFNIMGFPSGLVQIDLAFTVTETGPDNALDESNTTGTVAIADRPGGFIGGVPVPGPHDVFVRLTDFGTGATSIAVFANVILFDDSPPPVDSDGDGEADNVDNCLLIPNPGQEDTDIDGIGNACDSDLNQDCIVNISDLGFMKSAFFLSASDPGWNPDADFNGDGVVNILDLGVIKAGFFLPPGPSGIPNLCD